MDTLPSGTVVVHNPDVPVWDSTTAFRLEEDLRLGALDGTDPAAFGEIGGYAQDSAGRVYVLDQQAQDVRVFSDSGTYVRTIGRRGAGPGEFNGLFGIVLDQADQLWTVDSSNSRYQVFDSAGALQRTYRRTVGAVLYPFLGAFSQRGALFDVFPNAFQPGQISYSFGAVDTATARLDSLPPITFEYAPRDALSSMALFAVLPRLVFRFDAREFIWFGVNDQYRLYQRTLSGDTVRIIEKTAPAADVSSAEREAILEDLRKTNSLEQQSLIPGRKPFFIRLLPDHAGYLYVMLVGANSQAGTRFDVFDDQGRFQGRLAVPAILADRPAPTIIGDHLLAATQDSLGVNYVVRYRIVRPASRSSRQPATS